MKPKDFLKSIDEPAVLAAIRAAESRTSGEIRVYVAHSPLRGADPMTKAKQRFEALGMAATRERNAVLIYVNPPDQKFAILGDEGIHRKCGDSVWQHAAETLRAHLAGGRTTEGLVAAVTELAAVLEEHFPRRDDDTNELGDEIAGE